jgi:microcystin-dependent protein
MKKYLLLILALTSVATLYAQVGFNNPAPHPNSIVDLTANDKGLLVPRLTTAQRDAMTLVLDASAQSLLVYDTDLQGFYFYRAGNWYSLNEWVKTAGSNNVSLAGNASVTGTMSAGTVSATTLNVTGFANNALVPSGSILIWSGLLTSIPAGWALCDGGTNPDGSIRPDLRDRFVVGAGGSYARNSQGGVNSVSLLPSQMPSHSHGISTDGDHSHNIAAQWGGDDNNHSNLIALAAGDKGMFDLDRNFTFTSGSSGSHSHTISNSGGGLAHENRPPYWALAYIMKL